MRILSEMMLFDKLKKITAFSLATVVSAAVLASCGNSAETTQDRKAKAEQTTSDYFNAVITLDKNKADALAEQGVTSVFNGLIDNCLYDDILYVIEYYPDVFEPVKSDLSALVSYDLNTIQIDKEDGRAVIDVTLNIRDVKTSEKPDSESMQRIYFGFGLGDTDAKYEAYAKKTGMSVTDVKAKYTDKADFNKEFIKVFADEYRSYFSAYVKNAADLAKLCDYPVRMYATLQKDGSYHFTEASRLDI